ncbi:MAG: exonuclease domain-containing protein [Calditerrivibrio sp.]|nr:exonuclease domain-containing protein [Calditerrivibrio sp.]
MVNISDIMDKPLNEVSFVVFDLETTGLYPEKGDQIIEIGAFRIDEGFRLVKEPFHTLVKAEKEISESSLALHGISIEETYSAPDICTAIYDFIDFCRGSALVAHKASKDAAFLRHALRDYMIENPFPFILDTIKISQKLYPDFKFHNLDYLIERHNISINSKFKRHRALYDAEATAKIFLKMLKKLFKERCFHFSELTSFATEY